MSPYPINYKEENTIDDPELEILEDVYDGPDPIAVLYAGPEFFGINIDDDSDTEIGAVKTAKEAAAENDLIERIKKLEK